MRNPDLILAALLLALSTSCGASEIGEECETTGSTDECVEGAVCDTDGDKVVCLKQCDADEDCAASEECNGVSGSNEKACHPKK